MIAHFATVPGFWDWLTAHWPSAAHGCRFEFGARSGWSHWLQVCGHRPGLRHWRILVFPGR